MWLSAEIPILQMKNRSWYLIDMWVAYAYPQGQPAGISAASLVLSNHINIKRTFVLSMHIEKAHGDHNYPA